MKFFVEGAQYPIDILHDVFEDYKFFNRKADKGIITHVGYVYSHTKNLLIYLLPKVFLANNLVFGRYSLEEIISIQIEAEIKHHKDFAWARKLSTYFYRSLAEFRYKHPFSDILENEFSLDLQSSLGSREYSYMDLVLSFIRFYKANKSTIAYKHVESISKYAKKPKWERTVRRSRPILIEKTPVYVNIANKRLTVNREEELIIFFLSILNHFNSEHALGLKLERDYNLITGRKFESLKLNGLTKLKKIKHRYFSDIFVKMYKLCEIYFKSTSLANSAKQKEEFITVRNYNIVFEDMIDQLFSDELDSSIKVRDYSIPDLKMNRDGKIIDHIYEDKALIDQANIFYIGDSKYYKQGSTIDQLSTFKQFTYSKNIIQFNIDLFNKSNKYYNEAIRYRDVLTEGYNITPNFFINGYVNEIEDFENPYLKMNGEPKKSFHFADRLFDRDTLFVQQYLINFLFVLRNYSLKNVGQIKRFRNETRGEFRKQFIDFFNDNEKCGFSFCYKQFEQASLNEFVIQNFRALNGKAFSTLDHKLIVATSSEDHQMKQITEDFHSFTLS